MAINYGIFFTRDDLVIRLPINPEKLPVDRDNANDNYNVLGIGPIMVPRIPKLKVVKISGLFPGRPYAGVLTPNNFQAPEFYIQFFESAMNDKAVIIYTPVRYYENGEPFMTSDVGFPVLVTSFSTEERGGETGDFYYDLEITEYRDYSPQIMQIEESSANDSPAIATTEPARDIPSGQITVGCKAVANGNWYYTSYGEEPYGAGSGQTVIVSRIVDGDRECPIHVTTEDGSPLGWMSKEALQVIGE